MDCEYKFTTRISSEFISKAEDELFEMLLRQYINLTKRFTPNTSISDMRSALRWAGMFGCFAGFTLTLFYIIKTKSCPSGINEMYLLPFAVLGVMFYFNPLFDKWSLSASDRKTVKNCIKITNRCMREATNLSPYQAEYEIKQGVVTYRRSKDSLSELAWVRKLQGVALHGKYLSVFFKKWNSVLPALIILHTDHALMETLLLEQRIAFKKAGRQVVLPGDSMKHEIP